MWVLTDAYLQTQLALLIWPMARILGLFMTMPFLSDLGVPTPIKILLGFVISACLSTTLGPLPAVSVGSWEGLLILSREVLIGSMMGLVLQILFSAISVAGEIVGTQMGLGFSTLYDPGSESTATTLSSLWVALACLMFFAIDGHLMVIATLAKSFEALPISAEPFALNGLRTLVNDGGIVFLYAITLSLPVTLTMILLNLALGILTRAAPQLNLFSIGFPITLAAGMGAIVLSLSVTLQGFDHLWAIAISSMERLTLALR